VSADATSEVALTAARATLPASPALRLSLTGARVDGTVPLRAELRAHQRLSV
jgi:hypothetical protein